MALFKSILKGLAALLALLVLVVAGVFAWNMWKLQQRSVAARESAAAVCAKLPPGTPVASALERAEAAHGAAVALPAAAGYEFQFMYFLGGWACRAEISEGKITRVAVVGVD